jgi:hypothetical protein
MGWILSCNVTLVTGRDSPYNWETLRLPHFLDHGLTAGGNVKLTHRQPLTPREECWYAFLLEAEAIRGS